MYVLLKNTLDLNDKGFYIKTKVYDRDVEKKLIELYFRDIIDGLIEYSTEEIEDDSLEVIELVEYLNRVKNKIEDEELKNFIDEVERRILVH